MNQGCGRESYEMPPTTPAPKLELPAWAKERVRSERPEVSSGIVGSSPSRHDNVNGRTQRIPDHFDHGRVITDDLSGSGGVGTILLVLAQGTVTFVIKENVGSAWLTWNSVAV